VLFYFVRLSVDDAAFSFDVNGWLEKLVTALLHVGSNADHRFLLNHIIRFVFSLRSCLTCYF